jgi:hypothetical protein
MNRSLISLLAAASLSLLACGHDAPVATEDDDAAVLAPGSAMDAGADGAPDAQGPLLTPSMPEASTVEPESDCGKGDDADGDGFTRADGDCNDCDKLINPGAYDFPGNMFDEDCSGAPAPAEGAECDQGLDIASSEARDAARAIGLCKFTSRERRDWGVIEARFTSADGSAPLDSPLQVGLVPSFGAVAPRAGKSLLALSSGVARAPDQPGYTRSSSDTFNGSAHAPLSAFPKQSSACPPTLFDGAAKRVFNQAALELTIRVPSNARSLSFDSIFYSYEYPDFICEPFNDFFIALLTPAVSADGNIVFDPNGDPIGVNTGLLAVCDPSLQQAGAPKQFACAQGTMLLRGTGFGAGEYSEQGLFGEYEGEGGASTGWLTTLVPAPPGAIITLRFAVWDTGDFKLDSTALVDRFVWSIEQPSAPMTRPTPVLL